MTTLIGISLSLFLAFSMIMFVGWRVHIQMTKDNSDSYGYGNYKLFKQEINKYQWDDQGWKNSLFSRNNGGYIHASVYQFNHIGMVMRTPWDYILSELLIRKRWRIQSRTNSKNNYQWRLDKKL